MAAAAAVAVARRLAAAVVVHGGAGAGAWAARAAVAMPLPVSVARLHAAAAVAALTPVRFTAGESVTSGQVSSVLVSEGSVVAIDQVVASIDTDKVVVEVRADRAGVVRNLTLKVGAEIAAGAAMFEIDPAGAGAAPAPQAPRAAAAPAAPPPPPPAAAKPAAPPAPPAPAAAAAAGGGHVRVPLIQFRYGKRTGAPAAPPAPPRPASAASAAAPAPGAVRSSTEDYAAFLARTMPSKATKSFLDLPPQYGRPRLSPAESAAIDSGGAY